MPPKSQNKGTWCSWLSRSLSMREVSGSIPDVSIVDPHIRFFFPTHAISLTVNRVPGSHRGIMIRAYTYSTQRFRNCVCFTRTNQWFITSLLARTYNKLYIFIKKDSVHQLSTGYIMHPPSGYLRPRPNSRTPQRRVLGRKSSRA